MGNSCNARTFAPQQQIKIPVKQKAVPRINTSVSSNFVQKMNAMLDQPNDDIENEAPKTTSQLKYVQPKIIQQQKSLDSDNKLIFTAILRTQFKGKIFFNQNDIKSDISLLNHRQNVQEVAKQLSENDIKQISAILDNHFLFLQLNKTEKIETIKQMKIFSSEAGTYIFKEGDDAESFFIISQGQVQVIIDSEVKKVLKSKQSFGQIALLFGSKRTASVKSITNCLFWGIDRSTFKKIVDDINQKIEKQNRQFLQKTDFFNYLTPIQQQSVLNLIVTLKYQPGDTIVNDGKQFYIIKSGKVIIQKQNGEQIILEKGNEFGNKSFDILNSRDPMNIRAKTQCEIICITKDQIMETLGSTIQNVMIINRVRKAMEKSKRFRVIQHKNMQHFLNDFNIKKVSKGQKIMKKGHIMKNFYIPLDVQLISVNKTYPNEQIIEQNLLLDGHPLLHGITAQTDGSLLVIKASADIFNQVISFKSQINPNAIKLDNVQIIRKIGSGQFGDVYAAIHLSSNSLVAVKSISKKTVQKFNVQKQIVNEQNVMKSLNHPFIVKYFNTFIAKRQIYFIMQYIAGKQLFDVIRQMGLLKSHEAQFFAAQILLALEYIHNLQIIYRDLKPENIMVDNNGYLKLIDMGTAKLLKKQSYYKTRTVIGTPHYMAPQIISGKGYNFLSDLWSFGILLYEFVCGYLPYEDKNNDPFEIYKQIMNRGLDFPGYMKDIKIKQIIIKLLNKTPQSRMSKGYNQLKKMQFFEGLDWVALQKNQIPSVYKMPQNIGINLQKIHRQDLLTIPEYFEKIAIKQGSAVSRKQISWESNLLDNQ